MGFADKGRTLAVVPAEMGIHRCPWEHGTSAKHNVSVYM